MILFGVSVILWMCVLLVMVLVESVMKSLWFMLFCIEMMLIRFCVILKVVFSFVLSWVWMVVSILSVLFCVVMFCCWVLFMFSYVDSLILLIFSRMMGRYESRCCMFCVV